MINLDQRISAFSKLGVYLTDVVNESEKIVKQPDTQASDFEKLMHDAVLQNPWFTRENCLSAFRQWAENLSERKLKLWLKPYEKHLGESLSVHNVGVVNAGNLPLVGFHDFLSVIIAGHNYIGKNASDDSILLPYVSDLFIRLNPEFAERISFVNKLTRFEAVIATGNNNSARYFEHYFGKVPHIIRKNRNGIAVLDGTESREQLQALGLDIFLYFGLGCRNVSKIYVPENYNFSKFFESILTYQDVMMHNKYMNNFDYNNTVFLLKQIPFLQNGFLIIKADQSIASPIAVVHYEIYSNKNELEEKLIVNKEKIQCIALSPEDSLRSVSLLSKVCVHFGKTQFPGLNDYADGMDTVEFLTSL